MWFFFALLSFIGSCSSTQKPSSKLIERLLDGYNAQASPHVGRTNDKETSTSEQSVSIRLARAVITSVDERDMSVRILATVNYKWFDPRLAWDPSKEDGINEISLKADAIWRPDIYPCESIKISPILKDFSASGAAIKHDGSVRFDTGLIIGYICQMNFDAFPFDSQRCSMCFSVDGPAGVSLNVSQDPIELRSISEWDVAGNLTSEEERIEQDGMHSHRVLFHFSLIRRSFFWIFLIIIPTFLFCLVALVGVFFYEGHDAVQTAASIGLTTMTSLMLVVIILSDALDKANNLPELGWLVFVEIVVVCVSVIIVLLLDAARALALRFETEAKGSCPSLLRFLTAKRLYRTLRFTLFMVSITALVLNIFLT